MLSFRRLETPKIWAVIKTQTISDGGVVSDSTLTDPTTSTQVIIEDSVGTVVQALAGMTKDSTGKYSYNSYTIPSDANTGTWHYEVRATDNTVVSTEHGAFEVLEEVA